MAEITNLEERLDRLEALIFFIAGLMFVRQNEDATDYIADTKKEAEWVKSLFRQAVTEGHSSTFMALVSNLTTYS